VVFFAEMGVRAVTNTRRAERNFILCWLWLACDGVARVR
jgi:hypothetical protein